MKILKPKKRIAVALASLLFAYTTQLCPVVAEDVTDYVSEVLEEISGETTETDTEESDMLSSVTVIHTTELSEEEYDPTQWWKADLEDYDENLDLVDYESIEIEEVEATLVAESTIDDTVVSTEEAVTAVTTTSEGTFAFTTYGWGHGVGMSQNGANFYANYAGWDYQQILFHYYPGTVLMNTGTAETELVTVQGVEGNVLEMVAEIVYCEVGSSMNIEAIKAQAVAVYTYIKYYGNNSKDLKGRSNPPQRVIDACASVLGEALYYNGSYALTMFYASSGGITACSSDIFTMDLPYLRSVSSEYDASHDPYYGLVTYFTITEMKSKLQSAYGITLSDNPENWITIVSGNGGYVKKVIIDGQVTVRGDSFRTTLGLRSPKFTYICSIPETDTVISSEDTAVEETTASLVTDEESGDIAEVTTSVEDLIEDTTDLTVAEILEVESTEEVATDDVEVDTLIECEEEEEEEMDTSEEEEVSDNLTIAENENIDFVIQ